LERGGAFPGIPRAAVLGHLRAAGLSRHWLSGRLALDHSRLIRIRRPRVSVRKLAGRDADVLIRPKETYER